MAVLYLLSNAQCEPTTQARAVQPGLISICITSEAWIYELLDDSECRVEA